MAKRIKTMLHLGLYMKKVVTQITELACGGDNFEQAGAERGGHRTSGGHRKKKKKSVAVLGRAGPRLGGAPRSIRFDSHVFFRHALEVI
jgi:hypothetical protein